ncbi:hypothetical protein D9M68_824840 [compost metagenome]
MRITVTGFGLQTRDSRHQALACRLQLGHIALGLGRIESEQHIAFLDDIALVHEDFRHHATLQGLQLLHRADRHHLAAARSDDFDME